MTDDDVRFLEVTRGRSPPEKRGGAKTHVERRGRGGRRRRGVRAARGPVRAGIVRAERRGGRGLGLVRAPASGHAPRGRGAAGCSKGLRKSSLPLAPPRAPGSAYGFAAPFSSNGLSAIVTCRATPRRPLAAVHERLEKNQTEKARDGVRRVRGDAVAVARPPIAAPRLRRRTRRWGRPRGARRRKYGGWRSRSFGTRARVFRRKRFIRITCHARLLGPRTAISNERSPADSWSFLSTTPTAFKSSRARAAVHRTHPPRPWLRSTSRCVSQPSRDFRAHPRRSRVRFRREVAVSPRLSRRSPFPPTSIRHTKPEGRGARRQGRGPRGPAGRRGGIARAGGRQGARGGAEAARGAQESRGVQQDRGTTARAIATPPRWFSFPRSHPRRRRRRQFRCRRA